MSNRISRGKALGGKFIPGTLLTTTKTVVKGTNTLTIDELKSSYLLITGSPTGAVNLIFNIAYKNMYVAYNQTDQTVTLKNTSGGTVSLVAGSRSVVMNDGHAMVEAVVSDSEVTLSGAQSLSNKSLSTSTFTGGTITGTDITAGTMTGTAITGGTITGAGISSGTMTGTAITGGTITGAGISSGTMTGTAITGGTITGTAITGGTITGAGISSGTMTGTAITGGTITGAIFSNGTITGTGVAFVGNTFTAGVITGTTLINCLQKKKLVTHDYNSAAVDWNLSDAELGASVLAVTNASSGVNAVFPIGTVYENTYLVDNQSGQALKLLVSGATGITIASTKRAFVWRNNTDIIRITADA